MLDIYSSMAAAAADKHTKDKAESKRDLFLKQVRTHFFRRTTIRDFHRDAILRPTSMITYEHDR